MLYDLTKALDREKLNTRLKKAKNEGEVVELIIKRPPRSLKQNRYLHLILSYFAHETGYTVDYVKHRLFKQHCNCDIFCFDLVNKFTGEVTQELRSSADITTAEMTTAIDRFRDWASTDGGIYLPAPDEAEIIREVEVEISKNKYL